MSWFYEAFDVESEFNGTIKVRRWLGEREILAGHIYQSGDYITQMWAKAIKHVPVGEVKKVLVLGLGTGGCLGPIWRRFRKCKIKVVEIDPVMIGLAKRLKMYPKECEPEILFGDAADILPRLNEKFDLIIWDMFVSGRTAEIVRQAGFVDKIADRLERGGYLIDNYFREPEQLGLFDRRLSRHGMWRFRANGLALYRHFGQGKIGDPLPEGYLPYRGVAAFLRRERVMGDSGMFVGSSDCAGSRWRHGPLWFEGYTGDHEPMVDEAGPKRIVIWQPVTRTDKPAGWRRCHLQMNPNLTGFADLAEADPYWESWTPHAQRHLKRWHRHQQYEIRELPAAEFLKTYESRAVRLPMKSFHVGLIHNKITRHGELNVFFGAFDKAGKMVAGFAALDIPEAGQSLHVASFILPEARKTSVGTGLVDAWFGRCLAKGYRFADFDLFWTWTDPWSWRGFSRFKGQFGVTFVRYPKPLFRIMGTGGLDR